MNTAEKWHGTTIVLLRKNGETVVATTVSPFFLSKTIVVPCHFSAVFITLYVEIILRSSIGNLLY